MAGGGTLGMNGKASEGIVRTKQCDVDLETDGKGERQLG